MSDSGSFQELGEMVDVDRLNDLFLAMYRFREDISKNIELARKDPKSFAKLQLRSRLFGKGVMSVRYLLDKLSTKASEIEGGLDSVEQYLGVMSLKDSLERLHPELKGLRLETEFSSLISDVENEKRKIRRELKRLLNNDEDVSSSERLLRWIESSFNYDQHLPVGAH